MEITKEELTNIYGGISFSATVLNAITKAISTVYDIGRRIGSSISRLRNGNVC